MFRRFQNTALLLFCLLAAGCSGVQFQDAGMNSAQNAKADISTFFPISDSQASFQQDQVATNETTAYVHVTQTGNEVTQLQKSDFTVTENGVPVDNFTVDLASAAQQHTVDIVFIVDVTGSMGPFIATAKDRLTNFIYSTRARGYHTRMCISTFGDYTVKKCTRFYDNDPSDPSTLTQVQELISEISQLQAYQGPGQDPGWPDLDENPMRALIDASNAPFRSDAQRFAILVTDAGFLYSPDHQGQVGSLAPAMSEVDQAITNSQITVFGITPDLPGYTTPFQGLPSIVDQSDGEHYLFTDVIQNKISLDTIFSKIIQRIDSAYKLTYTVDDVPGLDPHLPLGQRHVSIGVAAAKGQIKSVNVSSNQPDGSPRLKSSWMISDDEIDTSNLQVFVNGHLASSGDYEISNGSILFKATPNEGSKIKVIYRYKSMAKNLRMEPLTLPASANIDNLDVLLNEIPARPGDLLFQRNISGEVTLTLKEAGFTGDDHYLVGQNGGVAVRIRSKSAAQP